MSASPLPLSSNQDQPFSRRLPELTIKRLDVARLERSYRLKNEVTDQIRVELAALSKFIVDEYNSAHQSNDQQGQALSGAVQAPTEGFKRIYYPEELWNAIDHDNFVMEAYYCIRPMEGSVARMFAQMGVPVCDASAHSFLFLLYRTYKKMDEIFALCSGTSGYQPVQCFSDYFFPRKVAFRLLDDEDYLSKESTKRIIGPVVTAQETFRSKPYFDPNQIQKVYTGFIAAVRKNSSLYSLRHFQTKDGEVPAGRREVEIQEAGLRIHKRLSMNAYPPLINHLSLIARGEPTYIFPRTGKKRIREKDRDFAFLSYFTPVSYTDGQKFDGILLRKIAECIHGNQEAVWELSHPHFEDYFKTHRCRIRYSSSITKKDVEKSWDFRITYSILISSLKNDPLLKFEKIEHLLAQLEKMYFGFFGSGGWKDELIVNCLTGQFNTFANGITQAYFKLNKRWYAISDDLQSKVNSEFRTCLVESLISKDETGFLPHPWEPHTIALSPKEFAANLSIGLDILEEYLKLDVCFVEECGTVLQHSLEGDIRSNPFIDLYKDTIELLLKESTLLKEDLERQIGKSHAQFVWSELITPRKVLTKKTVTKKKVTQDIIQVINPFFPSDIVLTDTQKQKLNDLYFTNTWRMKEGPYNESYMYDLTNAKGNKKPYKINGEGWVVGDRIEPYGIELFDILYFDAKQVFLYHVKEGFGQQTRDACSQMMNSSRMIQDAKSPTCKRNAITQFYKMATKREKLSPYREKVRKQLLALTAKGFEELFTNREIVFVYAFVDDRVNDHTLTKSGIEKDSFSVKDFVEATGKDVAARIFKDLQKNNYLDKSGRGGQEFRNLCNQEQLQFTKPDLAQHREIVWHILAGDISFFGSLIGRMDLLHTRSQIEGMGFKFRICQIQRPYNLHGKSYKQGVFCGDIKSEIDYPISRKADNSIYYIRFWDKEIECYTVEKTKADGSCALHALLGTVQECGYQCDAVTERQNFAIGLRAALNPRKNGFTDTTLQELYVSNISSLYDEASRDDVGEEHPAYRIRANAKLIFPTLYELMQPNRSKKLVEVKQILSNPNATPRSELVKILRKASKGDQNLKEFKDALLNSDDFLFTCYESQEREIERLSNSSKSYSWLIQHIAAISKINTEVSQMKKRNRRTPDVMERFLGCVGNLTYWLCDDELEMLAHLKNLRVEILREDCVGLYGCNNYFRLAPRGDDPRPLVVIHGDQTHYSRCMPF